MDTLSDTSLASCTSGLHQVLLSRDTIQMARHQSVLLLLGIFLSPAQNSHLFFLSIMTCLLHRSSLNSGAFLWLICSSPNQVFSKNLVKIHSILSSRLFIQIPHSIRSNINLKKHKLQPFGMFRLKPLSITFSA